MPQLKVLNAATYPRVSTMRQVQEGFSLEEIKVGMLLVIMEMKE